MEISLAPKLYGLEAKECLSTHLFYRLTIPRTGNSQLAKHSDSQYLSALLKSTSRSVLGHAFGLSEIRHIVAGVARQAHVIHPNDQSVEREEREKDEVFDQQAGHSTRTSDKIYARCQQSGIQGFRLFSELYHYKVLGLKDVTTIETIYEVIGDNDGRMNRDRRDTQKLSADMGSLAFNIQQVQEYMAQLAQPTSRAALSTSPGQLGSPLAPTTPGLPPLIDAAKVNSTNAESPGNAAWDDPQGFTPDTALLTTSVDLDSLQGETDRLPLPPTTHAPGESDVDTPDNRELASTREATFRLTPWISPPKDHTAASSRDAKVVDSSPCLLNEPSPIAFSSPGGALARSRDLANSRNGARGQGSFRMHSSYPLVN
jgi:hypothetical protein